MKAVLSLYFMDTMIKLYTRIGVRLTRAPQVERLGGSRLPEPTSGAQVARNSFSHGEMSRDDSNRSSGVSLLTPRETCCDSPNGPSGSDLITQNETSRDNPTGLSGSSRTYHGVMCRDNPNGSSGTDLLNISVTQTEVVNSSLPHYSGIALSAEMERGERPHLKIWRTDVISGKMQAILELRVIFLCYNTRTISSSEIGWWYLLDVVKLCLWLLKTRDTGLTTLDLAHHPPIILQ